MRTENELRDAIRERADRAPVMPPELVVVRPTERHARRKSVIAVAAAAAAVAAVAVATSLVRDDHAAPTAARQSSPKPAAVSSASKPAARTTPVPPFLPARAWISYSGSDAVESLATVQAQYIELPVGRDGFYIREITAFAPGLFHTSLISNPQPVTVNGAKGYFGAILPWRNDDVSHTDPAHTDPRGSKYPDAMPALLWKIGADQWAAVISNAPGEGNVAALTAIAARVQTSDALVQTPIKIGYLPSGYRLSEVNHAQSTELSGPTSVVGFRRDVKYDYADWTVTVAPVAKPTSNTGPRIPGDVRSIYPEVHRTVGDYVITVATGGAISKAAAERVLASVTLAGQPDSPNDTWFTLAQALP